MVVPLNDPEFLIFEHGLNRSLCLDKCRLLDTYPTMRFNNWIRYSCLGAQLRVRYSKWLGWNVLLNG